MFHFGKLICNATMFSIYFSISLVFSQYLFLFSCLSILFPLSASTPHAFVLLQLLLAVSAFLCDFQKLKSGLPHNIT